MKRFYALGAEVRVSSREAAGSYGISAQLLVAGLSVPIDLRYDVRLRCVTLKPHAAQRIDAQLNDFCMSFEIWMASLLSMQ